MFWGRDWALFLRLPCSTGKGYFHSILLLCSRQAQIDDDMLNHLLVVSGGKGNKVYRD